MKPAYAQQVSVESPTMDQGLRVDHPRLLEYIRNGIKLGWGLEHLVKVTGAPPAVIEKVRSQHEKEKMK